MARKTRPSKAGSTKKTARKSAGSKKSGAKTTKKAAAKKKSAVKKTSTKKAVSKKKTSTKKAVAKKKTKKVAAKKTSTKKAVAKKKTTKKAAAKKTSTKKAVAKKKTAKKAAAKKTSTKKAVSKKKTSTKKAAAKKTSTKKAVAKKTSSKKKATTKKVTAKKKAATEPAAPVAAAPSKAEAPVSREPPASRKRVRGVPRRKNAGPEPAIRPAPEVGSEAPAFTLPADDGTDVSLSDLSGQYVVLYFYPRDATPGCTVEACNFRDATADLQARGAVVLGVSRDSVESHAKFVEKQSLTFRLLSDPPGDVISAYGAWGTKKFMGRQFNGILRSTVIIDPDGKVAKHYPKVAVKEHAAEVLADLDALTA